MARKLELIGSRIRGHSSTAAFRECGGSSPPLSDLRGSQSRQEVPRVHIPSCLLLRFPLGSAIVAVVRQFIAEARLTRSSRWWRSPDPKEAIALYSRLSPAEFDALNARQCWANWRLLPRVMHRRLPDRPLTIVDLGAGTGHSTEVLATCAPAGSRLLAIEGAPALARAARCRLMPLARARGMQIDVVCADILDPWHWADGSPVPPESLDLVNSTGLIGHHLSRPHAEKLVAYIAERLRPGGFAALDPGRIVNPQQLRRIAAKAGLRLRTRLISNPLDVNGTMIFQKPAATDE